MLKFLLSDHWPNFFISSLSSLANLFLPIILARILMPSDIGTYKVFFLFISLFPYFTLSAGPLYSVYFWSFKNDKYIYLQNSFGIIFIMSIPLLVLGIFCDDLMAKVLGLSSEVTRLVLIGTFFSIPSSFYPEAHIALNNVIKGSLYTFIFDAIKVICFIIIALMTNDIIMIFYSFVIILGLKLLLTIPLGCKENMISLRMNIKSMKRILNYSMPLSIASLITFSLEKIDLLILASYLNKEDFAFYTMGCIIIPPLYILEMSVVKSLIPMLVNSQHNTKIALSYMKKAISDIALVIIPSTVGLYYFSKQLIILLYGEKYIESVKYFEVFAFSYLLFLIPYDVIPRSVGKTKWLINSSLYFTPLSILIIYFFAKYSDVRTVLFVSLLLKLVTKLTIFYFSCKIMHWKMYKVFPWRKIVLYSLSSIFLVNSSQLLKFIFIDEKKWFLVSALLIFFSYMSLVLIPSKKVHPYE